MPRVTRTPSLPQKTFLLKTREDFKKQLQERIDGGKLIQAKDINNQSDLSAVQSEYYDWKDYNDTFLKRSFNNEFNEFYTDYDNSTKGIGIMDALNRNIDTYSFQYKKGNIKLHIDSALINLTRLSNKISLIEEDESIAKSKSIGIAVQKEHIIFHNTAFVVHGTNDIRKLEVARFIEIELHKKVIILHEQPNKGLTIIDKFEKNSAVDFAVAIWTGDDEGKLASSPNLKKRARQNVIFETGYFIGKLGRHRTIVLFEEDVEVPSDYSGVIYIPLSNNWQMNLQKEVREIYASA